MACTTAIGPLFTDELQALHADVVYTTYSTDIYTYTFPSLTWTGTAASASDSPIYAIVDSVGTLYWAQPAAGDTEVRTSAGLVATISGVDTVNPQGISIAADGNLWVVVEELNSGVFAEVYEVTPGGTVTFRGQNAIPERAVPTPDGAVWWLFDDGTDYGLIRWDGSATLIPVAGVDRAILPRPDSSVWVYDVPGARWVQATAAGVVSYNPCPGLPVAPLNFTAAAWNEDWSVVLGQDANGDVWQVGPTGAAGRWRVGRIGWSA